MIVKFELGHENKEILAKEEIEVVEFVIIFYWHLERLIL